MEEKIIGEQPESIQDNVQSDIVESLSEGTTCLTAEGSLGKFKDAESVLKAYNCLQAEFTRKCQKLSELERLMEDSLKQDGAITYENASKQATENMAQEIKNGDNQTKADLTSDNSEQIKQAESKPIFESEDWKAKVSAFLNENLEAKEYSGEIAREIMENKELQASPYALELAWGKVLQKEYKNPKVLAHDEKFINEQILSRDEIKRQVLDEYFKSIQNKKTPPLISSSGKTAGITVKEPTNMKEAKEAVARLFNLKGN